MLAEQTMVLFIERFSMPRATEREMRYISCCNGKSGINALALLHVFILRPELTLQTACSIIGFVDIT